MIRCEFEITQHMFVALLFSGFHIVTGQQLLWNKPFFSVNKQSQNTCPENYDCVTLSSCPILNNVLNSECVDAGKMNNLACGIQGSGLVCCPQYIDPRDEYGTFSTRKTVEGHRCGLSQVQGDNYYGIGANPWIARIGFRNVVTGEIKYPCAGSVINSRIILTAAHCALAKAENYKLFMARIGEWNTETEIDCGDEFCSLPVQDIAVSHVIVHPGFQKQTYSNNIALLVLRSKINYTVAAQPICLPDSWSVTNNNGMLAGWGKAARQIETPPLQQILHLPIIESQLCHSVYGATIPITEEHLCAGGEAGVDACSGFGGAPLFVRHGDTHYQVGILSFGSDQCGAPGVPSVYTSVKKHASWIQENIPLVYNN